MSAPSLLAGRYRVKERVGQGGMAEVFRAVASGAAGWEREVVVKRLLPDQAHDKHFVSSFLDEAKLLAKLNHPHIAQVLDLGESGDGIFLVIELIDGYDLRQLVMAHGRGIDVGLACLIVRDVAEALDYGFRMVSDDGVPLKLIHRDVSLSNIMISREGVVKLVDFGLAKALTAFDREQTADGVIKGKWTYVAPEVLRGDPADHRSDVFSTGVVLFELLAGRKLYKQSRQVLDAVLERQKPPPAPSTLVDGVPRELDAIVLKALSQDPGHRFQTAEELAAALDDLVHRRRVRPPHLTEFMTRLFAGPSGRLAATQPMLAVTNLDLEEFLPTDPAKPARRDATALASTIDAATPSPTARGYAVTPVPAPASPPAAAVAPAAAPAAAPKLTPIAADHSEDVTRVSGTARVPKMPPPKGLVSGTPKQRAGGALPLLLGILLLLGSGAAAALYFLR